jgi:uncharacterized protein YegP (UPF0339 family)
MKLQVFRGADRQWYAHFKNKGRILMASEGYKRKAGAMNVAASIRGNAIDATIDVLDEAGKVVESV